MDSESSVNMKLETLEKEYSMVLQQYEGAYNDFISNLQNPSSATDKKYAVLQGRTFWGTGGIKQGSAETVEDCESMCSSDLKCSGAIFNSDKKYCWTRSGEGDLKSGQDNDYALIPQSKQSLIVLKNLNTKLLDINKEIKNEMQRLIPAAQSALLQKDGKQEELNQSYASLLSEQMQLEIMLKEYETIEEELSNNELYVNQQNASVKFWLLLALIIMVLTAKQMTGLDGTGGLIAVIIGIVIAIYVTVHYS
jgi:hypothetical protein